MRTSERQLFRARFESDVCGGGRFTVTVVCLPAPLLDRLPVERVSGDLADSTRQLVRECAVAAVFSKLTWHFRLGLLSVATRRTPLHATNLIVQSALVESPVRSV